MTVQPSDTPDPAWEWRWDIGSDSWCLYMHGKMVGYMTRHRQGWWSAHIADELATICDGSLSECASHLLEAAQ